MIIDINSWHYKVYSFTYSFSGQPPEHTNLCQYVRRLPLAPLVAIVIVIIYVIMSVIIISGLIFGPIVGYLPRTWNPFKFFEHDMIQYQGLKLGKSNNAFQVYPWHVILGLLITVIHIGIYQSAGIHPLIIEGKVIFGAAVIIGLLISIVAYIDSDTLKLINQYLTARKQKFCPTVEFDRHEQTGKVHSKFSD